MTQENRLRVVGSSAQQRVLWVSFFAPGLNGRRGLPYLVVGAPGSGKTSQMGQLARAAGLYTETLLGSIRSPVDFLGVPFLRTMTYKTLDVLGDEVEERVEYTHYAPPSWAVKVAQHGRAIINYDEFNTCSMSVQAAMLRVLFEGVVGEFQLPPGVRQVACMNPVGQAAGGRELSMPLQNRVGMLEWPSPTPDGWTRHMLGGGDELERVDAAAEEAEVDTRYGAAWARALGEVTGFLRRRPEYMNKLPSGPGKAWPSARTNELGLRALAGSYVYALTAEERLLAVEAYVGAAYYKEFFTWLKESDLPDPGELLDGNAHFEHSNARLDRTAAVLSSCTALVTPDAAPHRKERLEALWKILRDVPDSALDVAVPSVTALVQAKLTGGSASFKALARLEPVMKALGRVD